LILQVILTQSIVQFYLTHNTARSGLASKHFIDTGAGVIDADYRGEVKVLLFNFSDVDFTVKEGDRVAQLVLERVCQFFLFSFIKERCVPLVS
jgi:deoxyuridine 5'-triphosphate nucleotidohydrolase